MELALANNLISEYVIGEPEPFEDDNLEIEGWVE